MLSSPAAVGLPRLRDSGRQPEPARRPRLGAGKRPSKAEQDFAAVMGLKKS